jgi:hypothetical protein
MNGALNTTEEPKNSEELCDFRNFVVSTPSLDHRRTNKISGLLDFPCSNSTGWCSQTFKEI